MKYREIMDKVLSVIKDYEIIDFLAASEVNSYSWENVDITNPETFELISDYVKNMYMKDEAGYNWNEYCEEIDYFLETNTLEDLTKVGYRKMLSQIF